MSVLLHINVTGNETDDKTNDLATKTILHSIITDIPINDNKAFIKQKINMVLQNFIPLPNKLKRI